MYARHSADQIHSTLIKRGQELGFNLPSDGICSAYIRTLDLYTFADNEKAFYSIVEAVCNWPNLATRVSQYSATKKESLTSEEMMLRDINQFFSTLSAFMNSEKQAIALPKPHDLFFRGSLRRFAISQNRHLDSLAQRGGVRELYETGNALTLTEFQFLLTNLRHRLDHYHRHAALLHKTNKACLKKTSLIIEICANNHLISIHYSPTQRKWHLRDSNILFTPLMSSSDLATTIFNCFNFAARDINSKTLAFTLLVKCANDNPHIPEAIQFCRALQSILSYKSEQKTRRDEEGMTVVHIAAKVGDQTLLTAAISDGADVNMQTNDGKTPLHVAILFRQTSTINQLLELGASPTLQNKHGIDPLGLAAACGNTEALHIFAKHGVDLNQRNKMGFPPLITATIAGLKSSIHTLLRLGANPNETNYVNHSALHTAIIHGHDEIAALLIETGIDLHIKTIEDDQAIHLAAQRGATKTLLLLLEKGASITAKNIDNATPLDLAVKEGNFDCAAILLAHIPAKATKQLGHFKKNAYSLMTGITNAIKNLAETKRESLLETTFAKENALGVILSQARPTLSINGSTGQPSLLDVMKRKYASQPLTQQTQRILQSL